MSKIDTVTKEEHDKLMTRVMDLCADWRGDYDDLWQLVRDEITDVLESAEYIPIEKAHDNLVLVAYRKQVFGGKDYYVRLYDVGG